jgi:hypothetical protein
LGYLKITEDVSRVKKKSCKSKSQIRDVFLAKARPEWDLRCFSKAMAFLAVIEGKICFETPELEFGGVFYNSCLHLIF